MPLEGYMGTFFYSTVDTVQVGRGLLVDPVTQTVFVSLAVLKEQGVPEDLILRIGHKALDAYELLRRGQYPSE